MIKIDSRYKKFGKICANIKGDNRSSMFNVYCNVEDKQAIATNGHVLGIIPLKCEEDDKSAMVNWDFVSKECKCFNEFMFEVKETKSDTDVITERVVTSNNGSSKTFTVNDLKYPDYKNVIPDCVDYKTKIMINAKLLYELAQALDSDHVELVFNPESIYGDTAFTTKIIKVISRDNPEATGFIMPLRLSN